MAVLCQFGAQGPGKGKETLPVATEAVPGSYTAVVIVLDGSGSMKQKLGKVPKMQAAKQAILKVMESVPETTQVGLLVFGKTPGGRKWVVPVGPRTASSR